jgi:hypothetical protein
MLQGRLGLSPLLFDVPPSPLSLRLCAPLPMVPQSIRTTQLFSLDTTVLRPHSPAKTLPVLVEGQQELA